MPTTQATATPVNCAPASDSPLPTWLGAVTNLHCAVSSPTKKVSSTAVQGIRCRWAACGWELRSPALTTCSVNNSRRSMHTAAPRFVPLCSLPTHSLARRQSRHAAYVQLRGPQRRRRGYLHERPALEQRGHTQRQRQRSRRFPGSLHHFRLGRVREWPTASSRSNGLADRPGDRQNCGNLRQIFVHGTTSAKPRPRVRCLHRDVCPA